MKLLEHIYAVKNLINNGIASDDSRYSNPLIAHLLKITRSKLIEMKADKYYFISDQSFQSLCVNLELGTFHNCCEAPEIGTECYILKSVIAIPKILNTRWGDFMKVTTLDGHTLSKTSITANSLAKYTLTNKTPKPGWFIHDGRLYLLNNKKLETVLLNGLFSDPKEISDINCSVGQGDCPPIYDEQFPLDSDLIDPMYKMTIEYLMKGYTIAEDNESNAKATEVTNERE